MKQTGAANNDDEGDNEGDDQIEFLEGVQVYACNICDEWFDIEDKIKKYIAVNHKDILIEISKKVDEEEDDNCSE